MVEEVRIVDLEFLVKEMKFTLNYCLFELEYYWEGGLLGLKHLRLELIL